MRGKKEADEPVPALEAPSVVPAPRVYARYRVKHSVEIPGAPGGGNFFLPAGQVLSEQHYDIAHLQRYGAVLEEVTS